ncbi:Guanosine-diphosphatase [Blyttiomyces sp. JEL0837]|nr:Guanosine-diphosphatase [Blyttiomyces sp. JEL0837]
MSSSYGQPPSRGGGFFTIRRLVAAVGVLIGIYFLFSLFAQSGSKDSLSTPSGDKKLGNVGKKLDSSNNQTQKDETCTPPSDRPPKQYALMIDAGSTGSRIHVYSFNYCKGLSPTLEHEIFEQIKPGLSHYHDSPDEAAKSLDVLLKKALDGVPEHLHSCTPVAVKATAGLRLIGVEKAQAILAAVRNRLEENYPFKVVEQDGVVVMDGKDEGVFAWITVNYLLSRIGASKRQATAAIIDLGGGSTQIVFEPNQAVKLIDGDHRVDLTFGDKKYVLYQHSYLGYGLMEAREKLLTAAVDKTSSKNPCLPSGFSKTPKDKSLGHVKGTGSGFPACSAFVANHLFDKAPDTCSVDTCSWDGVYQPKFSKAFPDGSEIYAFSYIYDRSADLGVFHEQNDEGFFFNADQIRGLAEIVCADEREKMTPETAKLLEAEKELCLDLGYIYHLLTTGYEIPGTRSLRTAKKIKGMETGWCLGASIHMLDQLMSGPKGSKGVCKA